MANIGFFDIPTDDVDRAKKFYSSLLGWKIEPAADFPYPEMQRQTIQTGDPEEGTMHAGGLYKCHVPGPIMNFVLVKDLETVLANIENLGGTIVMPKTGIETVGFFAVMKDTEGNILGLLQRPV